MEPIPWDMIGAIFGGLSFLLALRVEWNRLGGWRGVIIASFIGLIVFGIVRLIPFIFSTPAINLKDEFNNPAYDGQYDKSLWFCERCNSESARAFQQDESLRFEVFGKGTSVELKSRLAWTIDQIASLEGRVRFDKNAESGGIWLAAGEANCFLRIADVASKRLVFQCGFVQLSGEWQYATDEITADFDRSYVIQITFNHEINEIRYYLDGELVGKYTPSNTNSSVEVRFGAWTDTDSTVAYIDDVNLKTIP